MGAIVRQVATGGRRVEAAEGLLGPQILWISRSHSEDVEKGSIGFSRFFYSCNLDNKKGFTIRHDFRLRLYEIDTYQLVLPVIRGLSGSGVQLLQK